MEDKVLPLVTVIMPIRNEEKYICRSLGAVLSQDYPYDRMEIIIADGMSTDRTRQLINETHNNHPQIQLVVIDNPERTVPYGFNRALAVAKGDVILRVDGHTVIASDYVMECIETLACSGCENVGGRMDAQGENFLACVVSAAISSPFGVGGAKFHYSQKEELVDTVYMGAWRREIFEQLGGFDVRFTRSQDSEFNYRLRAHGGRILLSPRIKSIYYTRTSLRKLWRQYYQYGFYKIQVIFRHPKQFQPRQLVPPLFMTGMLSGVVILPLASGSILSQLWLAGVITYLLLDVLFSLRAAIRDSFAYFPTLLLIFPIIHVSWALGFFGGLINMIFTGDFPRAYTAAFQLRSDRTIYNNVRQQNG